MQTHVSGPAQLGSTSDYQHPLKIEILKQTKEDTKEEGDHSMLCTHSNSRHVTPQHWQRLQLTST